MSWCKYGSSTETFLVNQKKVCVLSKNYDKELLIQFMHNKNKLPFCSSSKLVQKACVIPRSMRSLPGIITCKNKENSSFEEITLVILGEIAPVSQR